jgi:hypothetical protein
MDYKKEIEKVLDSLKQAGFDRGRIEKDMEYSPNYIDQTLSKGGNKRFLKAMVIYRMAMLQKPISSKELPNTAPPVLSDKDRLIEQMEERRKDAESMARKMEQHYEDSKAEKAELFTALKETRQTINELLKPMVASLKEIPPVLDTIVRNSNEHDKEIMKALDQLVGNTPGTLEKESGKRILKGAMVQQKKGKAEAGT